MTLSAYQINVLWTSTNRRLRLKASIWKPTVGYPPYWKEAYFSIFKVIKNFGKNMPKPNIWNSFIASRICWIRSAHRFSLMKLLGRFLILFIRIAIQDIIKNMGSTESPFQVEDALSWLGIWFLLFFNIKRSGYQWFAAYDLNLLLEIRSELERIKPNNPRSNGFTQFHTWRELTGNLRTWDGRKGLLNGCWNMSGVFLSEFHASMFNGEITTTF